MSDISQKSYIFSFLPTEILLFIFALLPAKDLTRCRQVCVRWLQIIDELCKSEIFWRDHCKKDFEDIYEEAGGKCKYTVNWCNVYKSLSLWPKLELARESVDEFAAASNYNEEIRNFVVLRDGIIGVHKRSAIVYYDISTLEVCERSPLTGDYSKYTENGDTIVVQNFLNLHIVRRYILDPLARRINTYDNVKMFYLVKRELFYVTLQDEVFLCDLDDYDFKSKLLLVSEDGIMCLGYTNKHLNVLTFQRNIYKLVGNKMVFLCTLGPDTNLLHQLSKYNFLERLDWRVYFQWMFILSHSIPEGPLSNIITVKCYGDVVLVGSNLGVLRIYYAPYSEGEFDLFNTDPVKQYNFMERKDCPVLSMCPIIQIDVVEIEDGHIVLVGMPKKIAVIEFTHSFKKTASVAMLSYKEMQESKVLKINETV